MTTDLPTFIEVPVTATERYWQDYAVEVRHFQDEFGANKRLLITHRTGATGRSDAQYIVDRLASGLFFGAKIIEPGKVITEPKQDKLDPSMFVSVGAEDGTYAVRVYSADLSESVKLPLGRISADRAMRVADAIVDMLKKGWV